MLSPVQEGGPLRFGMHSYDREDQEVYSVFRNSALVGSRESRGMSQSDEGNCCGYLMIEVLQINLHRSGPAMNLVKQSAAERGGGQRHAR